MVCHRPTAFFAGLFEEPGADGGILHSVETTAERIRPDNVLGRLPAEISGKLLASERTITLRAGDTLFERGDAGDGCYWLRRGVLAVSVASANGEQRILAILGPGELVGEIAMIDGLPRSATVRAVRDCVLSFVSRAVFTEVLNRHPECIATSSRRWPRGCASPTRTWWRRAS